MQNEIQMADQLRKVNDEIRRVNEEIRRVNEEIRRTNDEIRKSNEEVREATGTTEGDKQRERNVLSRACQRTSFRQLLSHCRSSRFRPRFGQAGL